MTAKSLDVKRSQTFMEEHWVVLKYIYMSSIFSSKEKHTIVAMLCKYIYSFIQTFLYPSKSTIYIKLFRWFLLNDSPIHQK